MQSREFADTLDASIAEGILRLAGYDAVRNGATVMTDASEITLDHVEKIVVKKRSTER